MKIYLFTVAVFLLAVMLSACSLSSPSDLSSIQKISWDLIEINQGNLLEGSQITLTLEDNQVTGNAGCNIYSANYEASENSITFGPIVQTEMACMEPTGIMEQERAYLEILGAAQRYEAEEDSLTIVSEGGQTLRFQPLSPDDSGLEQPDEQPSVSQANPTDEPAPTHTSEVIKPPVGFKEYRDSQLGISIFIPEEWYIQSQSIVEGEYAIFSSYPPDKYVGGEARQPGDTKCDLNLNSSVDSIDGLVQQWGSSSITSIISKEEIVLNSGNPGIIFVIDSMGRATTLATEVDNSLVTFTCWGEFERFDQIAATLHAVEETNL